MINPMMIATAAAFVLSGGALMLTPSTGALSMAAFAQDTTAPAETTPNQTPTAPAETPAATEELADFVWGSPDAPVTLVEYASFTCPHCADFHDRIWEPLKTEYIDTGKVKLVHREIYFDKFGLWAGMVAQCGGTMKYFPIADMIYEGQRDWIGDGQDTTVSANLRKIGLKAGLSEAQVDACMNDTALAEKMVAKFQKTAGEDAVDSTPTLFINGEKHSNMSWDDLKAVLDEKLGG